MPLWLLTHWKPILAGVSALLIGLGLGYKIGHWQGVDKGEANGFAACEKEKFEAFQKGAESRKEIDVKVKRLSASDVDKLLTANEWMRTH